MATLEIRARLKHFRLIASLDQVGAESIAGFACFEHVPPFAGLEALAQLAALHARYLLDFRRHAFLLKVVDFRGLPGRVLEGRFLVRARLASHSRDAFRYLVAAEATAKERLAGELLIGVRDYDARFEEKILYAHFRKMFADLCKVSPAAGKGGQETACR